jgi:hypothetical protein
MDFPELLAPMKKIHFRKRGYVLGLVSDAPVIADGDAVQKYSHITSNFCTCSSEVKRSLETIQSPYPKLPAQAELQGNYTGCGGGGVVILLAACPRGRIAL